MESGWIENRAPAVPFAAILVDLLTANLEQRPEKKRLFGRIKGTVGIALSDIEARVTLVFAGGRLRIEEGIPPGLDLVIRTQSDRVMDLNALRIVGGLPWVFDEAGRRVLGQLAAGTLKIEGMFTRPLLLTRLTKLMSVI